MPDVVVEYGTLIVTSDISGAQIYIDNASTGKVTPDTLTVQAGIRTVRLEKEGYVPSTKQVTVIKNETITEQFTLTAAGTQKVVLLEDFANVSCVPCVTSNQIIERLAETTYGSAKLVVIKFPTNFPSPSDPFYTANKPDCNARISFYNVIQAPTVIIDGVVKPIPSDSISTKQAIETRLNQAVQFSIEGTQSISGSDLTVSFEIELIDSAGISPSDIVVHTVVTETNIEFATPPGSNGETKFYYVMRSMLPSNSGESLSGLTAPGQKVPLTRVVPLSPSWDASNLQTVVFVQNKRTKEVYQAVLLR